jgi:hypothetical protein
MTIPALSRAGEAATLREIFHRDAERRRDESVKSNPTGRQEPASRGGNDDQQSD